MRALARRGAGLAVAAALALLAAACGDEQWGDSPVVKEQALAAVETWLGACSNEDSEVVVELLPQTVREEIFTAPSVLAGCERIARLGLPPDAKTEELKTLFEEAIVERVEVDGGFGTAVLRGANGTTSELQLEIDEGRWMLSNPPLVAP